MRQNSFFKLAFLWCILTLFTGCGTVPQTPSGVTEPSGNARTDVGQESSSYITVAEAKAAVLENAGLLEEDVRFVRFYLDSADGNSKYDIEFISEKAEYDYLVNAVTGEILFMNYEAGDYNIESVAPENTPPADTQSEAGSQYIGVEAAKQIALAHAGVSEADAQYLKAELDYDDECAEYEVEWHVGQMEYSCDVDAYTGEILSFEKEFD